MANTLYFIMFLLSVLNIVFLSVIVKNQRSFYYVTFFLLISISCFGYVTIANATNAEVALQGNILTYFGACFLPYSFFTMYVGIVPDTDKKVDKSGDVSIQYGRVFTCMEHKCWRTAVL